MVAPQPPARPPGSYFEKKGEVHELRQLLRGAAADKDQQKKRDAIKKVIAYMTLGIDVSPLFSEMVMASATVDLVQKKMVYLYLVNYAESNSELAILAVNTFQKDCQDDDPMIRGLALRSLCSLNLLNMVEYLQPAVMRALGDVNGYVRKTAVIGVVKVFHISKEAVQESELLEKLKRLLHDSDAHVVTNTIYALEEVLADEGGLIPTRELVTSLLNHLHQFSEWGQCAVLGVLTKYQVADEAEMYDIMNILDGLLKQSSSAVVLAVTKIFMDLSSNNQQLNLEVLKRLRAPLLTLMASGTHELAHTVLVHIQAMCFRGADHIEIFGSEYKQFFCRYNEPSYIKATKIDILSSLADEASADPIVQELRAYVTDVDADISRRSIRAIGKIAVRVPTTAELIVGSLTSLLELDIDYVSTEAAVVMKDLVRKYPDQFQRASGAVERCMKIVTEPEGKCALLWILGEYGGVIDDAPYLLEPMIDGFLEESSGSVRLEMLTATVKLFFCRPPEMQLMLGNLLSKAIQETTHPDVRDRALFYYRLLETSPEDARNVICAPKDLVEEFQEEMDAEMRERVLDEFNTLSIVFKQPAAKFVLNKVQTTVSKMMAPPSTAGDESAAPPPPPPAPMGGDSLLGDGLVSQLDTAPAPGVSEVDLLGEEPPAAPAAAPAAAPPPPPPPPAQSSDPIDLLGMGDLLGGDVLDPLGGAQPPPPPPVSAAPAFALASGVNLNGQQFESLYTRLPQVAQQQRQAAAGLSMATAPVEEALRQRNVFVVASGAVGTMLKFYFYARQAAGPAPANPLNSEVWFLTELLMVPGGSAQACVKADNAQPASVECFVSCLWEALRPFLA